MRLNCTTVICLKVASRQFEKLEQTYIRKHHYPFSHGSELYGLQYNLVHLPDMGRNMYALLSPFKFLEWSVILGGFSLVRLVVYLQGVLKNPLFWLFSVLFEQGNSKHWKDKKACMPFLFILLYTALVLRYFYTSTLYTSMTVQVGPKVLPNSFLEILDSPSLPLLLSPNSISLINDYLSKSDNRGSSLYHLAKKANEKKWYLSFDGIVSHFRYNADHGLQEICDVKRKRFVDKSCVKPNRFVLTTENGPFDQFIFAGFQLQKLLLLLYNSQFQILADNDLKMFHTGQQIYPGTDNFLLSNVKMQVSFLLKAGKDIV